MRKHKYSKKKSAFMVVALPAKLWGHKLRRQTPELRELMVQQEGRGAAPQQGAGGAGQGANTKGRLGLQRASLRRKNNLTEARPAVTNTNAGTAEEFPNAIAFSLTKVSVSRLVTVHLWECVRVTVAEEAAAVERRILCFLKLWEPPTEKWSELNS